MLDSARLGLVMTGKAKATKRKRKPRSPTVAQKVWGLLVSAAMVGFSGWQLGSALFKGEMYGRGSLVMHWSGNPLFFALAFAFFLFVFVAGIAMFAGMALSPTAAAQETSRLAHFGRPGDTQVVVDLADQDKESRRSK